MFKGEKKAMAKEIVAMILAGGRGSRLYALTQKTAKPAVSFGGKYRIVDFPLSNCVNSSIDTVGIATQYQPQKLNEYIGNGQPWDLDRLYGGVHTLPPYEQAKGTDWYKGTANAIYQNISFIDSYDPEYVIILSGDQICKQDYADFLRFHKEKGAEFSVAVMEVDWKEASRFGLMVADEDDKITEFQEKPPVPKSRDTQLHPESTKYYQSCVLGLFSLFCSPRFPFLLMKSLQTAKILNKICYIYKNLLFPLVDFGTILCIMINRRIRICISSSPALPIG